MSSHGEGSHGARYRLIITLTGLVGIVAMLILINQALSGGMHYDDVEAYEDAKGEYFILKDAPVLPQCATDILVSRTRTDIETIVFSCDDAAMLDVFRTRMDTEAVWQTEVFTKGRVLLTPIQQVGR